MKIEFIHQKVIIRVDVQIHDCGTDCNENNASSGVTLTGSYFFKNALP